MMATRLFHRIAQARVTTAACTPCQPLTGRFNAACSFSSSSWSKEELRSLLSTFDAEPPVARARTPPGSWYTSKDFLNAEADSVFTSNWLHVGRVDQLATNGSFFTGKIVGQPYIVSRTTQGEIRAMYNVCSHHAAVVESRAEGCSETFTCPYHGWCYKNDGRLWKAMRVKGIEDFRNKDYGLKPIQVDTLGPFVFISFSEKPLPPVKEVLGEVVLDPLLSVGRMEQLRFVRRITYEVKSNWKVFCDNYLDGGYHVPIAHPDLAAGLDEDSYTIEAVKNGTVQSVPAAVSEDGGASRLGTEAKYSFAYPNFMLNRYGPWLDTNTAIPTGPDSCTVIFDYYLDEAELLSTGCTDIAAFVDESLVASDQVQKEDEHLCDIVQQGLASKGYGVGRYVPALEHGMHSFHQRIHADVSSLL